MEGIYLFIGGGADGRRIKASGKEYERVPVLTHIPKDIADIHKLAPAVYAEIEVYKLRKIYAPGHEYRVYAEQSMSDADMLASLIKGYSPCIHS